MRRYDFLFRLSGSRTAPRATAGGKSDTMIEENGPSSHVGIYVMFFFFVFRDWFILNYI